MIIQRESQSKILLQFWNNVHICANMRYANTNCDQHYFQEIIMIIDHVDGQVREYKGQVVSKEIETRKTIYQAVNPQCNHHCHHHHNFDCHGYSTIIPKKMFRNVDLANLKSSHCNH